MCTNYFSYYIILYMYYGRTSGMSARGRGGGWGDRGRLLIIEYENGLPMPQCEKLNTNSEQKGYMY